MFWLVRMIVTHRLLFSKNLAVLEFHRFFLVKWWISKKSGVVKNMRFVVMPFARRF